jgi:hypothetical protein
MLAVTAALFAAGAAPAAAASAVPASVPVAAVPVAAVPAGVAGLRTLPAGVAGLRAVSKADTHGCRDGDVCGYQFRGFSTMIMHYHYATVEADLNGINLSGADNKISGVINLTPGDMVFCRYPDGGGYCWVQPSYTAWDYAAYGWQIDNWASWFGLAR